ncbi:hypothetical protein EVAR_7649_1 [Eumeta japonica]|uniref:Uncharacterized protein n=1 Tax=Eumeta variegata TaxID=151549 RepID=A0A4C1TI79_EUMVA|nr:hypothetical protein EVAR_7649_1 [Eumeta japonica]
MRGVSPACASVAASDVGILGQRPHARRCVVYICLNFGPDIAIARVRRRSGRRGAAALSITRHIDSCSLYPIASQRL